MIESILPLDRAQKNLNLVNNNSISTPCQVERNQTKNNISGLSDWKIEREGNSKPNPSVIPPPTDINVL
jgi:hypothetical protein